MSDQTKSRRPTLDLQVLGPIIALAALILIGAMMNDNFLSYGNVTNVLSRSAFIGIIAVGMTFVITAEGWTYLLDQWRHSSPGA